jgi:hypothetical protein
MIFIPSHSILNDLGVPQIVMIYDFLSHHKITSSHKIEGKHYSPSHKILSNQIMSHMFPLLQMLYILFRIYQKFSQYYH